MTSIERKDQSARFKGCYVETYRGRKITVRRTGRNFGQLSVAIDYVTFSAPYTITVGDAVREVRAARLHIDTNGETK